MIPMDSTKLEDEMLKFELEPGFDGEEVPYILFADDDLGTLNALKFFTEYLGWKGEYVTNAREIIAKVSEKCHDEGKCFCCIVADINYFDADPNTQPRITGITAASEIRNAGCDVPIIFISGFSDAIIRDQAKELRGEIIVKPFDFDALFLRIKELIKWYRASVTQWPEDKERRRKSINLSGQSRRKSDQPITVSKALDTAIKEVKAEIAMRGSDNG